MTRRLMKTVYVDEGFEDRIDDELSRISDVGQFDYDVDWEEVDGDEDSTEQGEEGEIE